MYSTCPKCGHASAAENLAGRGERPACGLIFKKWFKHGNAFGGAAALWWLGQSAMDLAPCIYDARTGQLLLIGGFIGQERPGAHDWTNLLGSLGMLDYGHALGTFTNCMGMTAMVLALAWGPIFSICSTPISTEDSDLSPEPLLAGHAPYLLRRTSAGRHCEPRLGNSMNVQNPISGGDSAEAPVVDFVLHRLSILDTLNQI